MTKPDDRHFGDDAPEADVAEQLQSRDWEADEADLIEQAIAVPDDDSDFDR